MKIRCTPHFVLLIIFYVLTASCQEKGSLTYVIDNTKSMRDDIDQVKESADAITKIVFEEKASQIKNMILVTFNDPHAKLEIDTESRDAFKRHVNNISVSNLYGNWDCEEPSLKGLLMGLEKSRPGSFIYAFTDASAKDYWKSREIKNLCQKKQSQITFVLTGNCYGRLDKGFQVYYDIATACSGIAFYVSKHDVDKVLATIKESISGNKTVITAVKAPPGKYTNIPFVIDDQTEYATVTVAGSFVSLSVTGPRAIQEKVLWIRNAKEIKLSDPTPGQYIARVRGQTEMLVRIVGRTDFFFNHGFSALEPKSIRDTTPQPIANAETHLLIAVTDPKHTVNIISAQILDMNENVRHDLPLRKVSKDFYTTGPFVAPSKIFKVAVTGKAVRNSKVIRRIAKIPITPQDPPKPKSKKPVVNISEGNTTEVEYGSTVKLTCKVSAYPEPTITWKYSQGTTLISQNSAFELPYEYISYLTIKDALKRETYTCWGKNGKGTDFKNIEVSVKEPFNVKSAVKGTTKFKYGEKATLSCDITAPVPMHIIWSYEDKSGTSKNIVNSTKYQTSEDGKQLYFNEMDLDMVGKYSCNASLDSNPKKFVVFSTQVDISGLMQPKITGEINKTTPKGSKVVIECRVSGVPKPSISWQFMGKGESKFLSLAGSNDVLSMPIVDEKHAGSYKCVAHNAVGDAEHITTLTVQVLPTITGVTAEKKSQKGLNVAIECHVSGIPKPTITWQFMAQNDTKFVSISGSKNILHVSNVGEEHAGRYKCIASNVLGTSEHVTTLIVHVPPTITGVGAKTAPKGSNIVIDCNVYGIPLPTITWQFKAEGDSKFVSIPGSADVLNIPSVNEKHAGSYKCIAHNIVGDSEHVTIVTVQVRPKVTGIASQITSRGSNVDIKCHVSGIPKPIMTWQFLSNNDLEWRSIPGSGNELHISKVDDYHAGSYKCIGLNRLGIDAHVTALTVQVPPTVSGIPVKITIKGSNMEFKCQVSGIPQPTITWHFMAKDDSKFVSIPGSDNLLSIPSVDEKHAGRYKCVAINVLGTAEFVSTLIVLTLPKVTGLANKTALKGSNVDIECNVSGVPKPAVTWQFMAKDSSKFVSVPEFDNVLHISNVHEKQTGSYKCVANNSVGIAEHITTLTVQVLPKIINVAAETSHRKGSKVDIKCHVTGVPKPTITWQFKAEGDSKFVAIPGSDDVLSISSVDEKHAGSYKCVAHNILGDVEHVTTLKVEVAPKVTGIAAQTTSQGSNVVIKCNVSGAPQPTISWQFMSELGTSFVPIAGSDKVLSLSNVDEKQAGRYKCVAHNVVGDAEHITTLTVQVLPKIIDVAAETTHRKGSRVDIKCHVSGVPKPTITWQFKPEGDSKFVSIPGTDDVLSIPSVDEKHAGNYKCVAHNILGEVEHVTTLKVEVAPKVTGIAAQITSQGSNVVIKCNVSGAPQPTISWQFMSELGTSFVPIAGSDKVLRLSNVDEKQAGRYKCVAHNVVGDAEHITTLTVQVLPKVIDVAAETTHRKGSRVDIKCHVSGVPKPTITWQFKPEGDSKFVSTPGTDDVLSISSVDEKHAGSYKCVAHNILGDVEHVTTLNVQVAPRVTGVVAQSTPKGSNVVIKCNVSGAPQPTISWQFKSEFGTSWVSIAESDKVLSLSNVDEKQAGFYKCVAHNVVGDAEHITTLTVQVLPKVIGGAAKTTHRKGSNVDIKCHVSGIPKPKITWQFKAEGDLKFVSIPGSDDVLSIPSVDEKHAGSYKCVAHNILGDVEHVTTLNVQVAPKVTGVTAQSTPKGSNVVIKCNVSGAPQPTIHWQFMSEFGTSWVSIAESDKVLSLSNVDEKQAGRYKCVAQNIVGAAEHITSLTVQVLPKVIDVAAETTHQKGSRVNIKCHVSGVPKPTITWQFKADGDSKFVAIPGSDDVLSIPSVDVTHAGSYKCVAHNVIGNVEHVTKLTVQVPPQILSSDLVAYESVEGRDAQLKIPCTTTGLPKPVITWNVNGATISPNEKYSIEDGTLVIKNPIVTDSQTYICEASNEVGSVKASFQANVFQVPKVSSEETIQKVIKGSPVTIECAIDGGVPKPKITWAFMSTNETKFVSLSQTDYTMRLWDINEAHSGQYKCSAKNVAGVAEHISILIVQEAPEITGIGEIVVHAGLSVDIECRVIKGIPEPTITWEFKGKRDSNFSPMPGTENVLHILGVQEMYSGSYKCIAHNAAGIAEHVTALNVEFAPIITSNTNITYEGLEGDLVLRIPCNVVGEPKPTIAWEIAGVEVIPNDRVSIVDGSLVIKEPKESDTNSYTCEAKNALGATKKTFTAEIHTVLGDPDKIKEVDILIGTSKKLECGSNDPSQKVRWFRELEEMPTKNKFIYLTTVDFYATGNYSCRVSDKNGAYTITYAVTVGTKPAFTFEQEDPVFDWQGSDTENDLLDCQADAAVPPVDVVWTYNGKVLEGKHTTYLSVDGNWGHYTCNISNVHGFAQKSFDVISSSCFIKRKPADGHIMPLILSQDFTWPVLDSRDDYLVIEPGSSIVFFCPSQKGVKNNFKILPTTNEISARCDKQNIFIVNDKPYKVSDLGCSNKIETIVTNTHEKCLTDTSESIRIGYDVHGFLQTYEVCFDTSKNIPLYTRVLMSKSNQGRAVSQSWYKYPGIGAGKSDEGYTCKDATSSCCYGKRQLVNARDCSDGPAQRSTFIDPLNAIPYWRPCEDTKEMVDPWDNVENMIRMQFSVYSEFYAWSGIHSLQEKNGLTIPRYLWKVVKFDTKDSIAIVHVNDRSFSETEDILCKNICVADNVPWIRELDKRTYCCNVDEFLKAFGLRDTPLGEALTVPLIDIRMKP